MPRPSFLSDSLVNAWYRLQISVSLRLQRASRPSCLHVPTPTTLLQNSIPPLPPRLHACNAPPALPTSIHSHLHACSAPPPELYTSTSLHLQRPPRPLALVTSISPHLQRGARASCLHV